MRLFLAATVLVAASMGAVCMAQTSGAPDGAASAPPSTPAGTTDTTTAKTVSFPKPLTVPQTWQLGIELGELRPILVQVPGSKAGKVFWYLRYTVTNNTREDHSFVPEIILYTDTGQLIRSGAHTPSTVFDKIKKLYNDPSMKAPIAMTGKLLQGEDNAKSSVAIWPDFDPNAGKVTVFFGGLSGETYSLPLPAPITVTETDWRGRPKTVTKDKLLLAKTLELQYAIPGERASRRFLEPNLVKKQWVMR